MLEFKEPNKKKEDLKKKVGKIDKGEIEVTPLLNLQGKVSGDLEEIQQPWCQSPLLLTF